MKKKFLTIAGTRPNLVKVDNKFKQVLCWTGQHYSPEMKDIFLKGLKIKKPDYDLKAVKVGQIIDEIIEVIRKEKPDYVIVIGDTRSTMAGAIAAQQENIPIIHIEAGLRSGNTSMIEERNRKLIDYLSDILFTIDDASLKKMQDEYPTKQIFNVGATQIDCMWNNVFPTKKPKDAFKYCVATVHRDFNVDDKYKLLQIMQALEESGEKIELYLHPRTAKNIDKFKIKIGKNIKVLKPCSYKQMINRMAFSKMVITDSGGLQLESYYLRRPSVVLRDDTEYWHSVESDWSQLVGSDKAKILDAIKKAHNGNGILNYYGDGTAHKRIRLILNSL